MARYGKRHKEQTRHRILETAARRFKQHGVHASGISVLMADAGLTNGAFYAHFASKDDLVAGVVAEQLGWQGAFIDSLPAARPRALAAFAGMVGTMQLARAVTDRQLSDDLLEHGIENALAAFGVEQQ